MNNEEKAKAKDNEQDNSDSDSQQSDDEFDMREIVLGLPALRLSSERSVIEDEAARCLNAQAVVAADLLMAAAEEGVMKGKSDKVVKKKLGRPKKNDDEAGGSKRKRKVPETAVPMCPNCNRIFHSRNAVYGHMRCHSKDKNAKPVVPPLKPTIPGPNTAFVRVASGGVVVAPDGGGASGGADGGAAPGPNVDVDHVKEDEPKKIVADFDLNRSPPQEDDEEDEA